MSLLSIFGSIALITPYVAANLFVIIGGWILAAKSLNRQFLTLTAEPVQAEAEKTSVVPGDKVTT